MRIRWRGFELPTRVVAEKSTLTPTYGKFVAEPFERGFGTTIGNSLRRILLSCLEGAAVTAVKIDGVLHEFSSIEGVYEDVAEILLNIKKLRFRLFADQPKRLTLQASDKGEVLASAIQPDPEVEIVTPNLHIATLTAKVDLKIEMLVRKGRGYQTAEENAPAEQEIGLIPLDSVFSPVQRVRYRVEDTRVGRKTNYDRLITEVWTDGSVSPEIALVEAAKIMRRHLDPFVYYFELGQEVIEEKLTPIEKRMEWVKAKAAQELGAKLKMPIEELELSARAVNCLRGENIRTIGDLVQRTEADLLELKNLGKTSVEDIKGKLAALELKLGMDLSEPLTGEQDEAQETS